MDKQFNSSEKESYWYNYWMEQRIFEKCSQRESAQSYCIMLPPPNVTGSLHMGHAFQDTLMDIMIRYHALRGYRVLWQVGTDHAGIATQMVVDRQLEAQGIIPKDLSREDRIAKIWEWKTRSGDTILSQLKRLGTAIDWKRERFTLDDDYQNAVQTAFVKLHRDGLIVKKKRLVNWDCHLQSAVSDLEVEHEDHDSPLYVMKYPIVGTSDYMQIATTRPETLFGDVAVAVHPDDLRYSALIGQKLRLPIINREIPIIADRRITPDFGTGCVKITPAHDFFDFEVGVDSDLPFINILNANGSLNEQCAQFEGIDRLQARRLVLDCLESQGHIESILPNTSSVPFCARTGQRIEPYLTDQWYVTMKPLADRALQAYHDRQFVFASASWGNHYEQWLTGIQDWCISRQLIWGHRIPAWTDSQGTLYVGANEREVREYYHLADDLVLTQDEDVLDTWFSSALWPFATLGWPDADALEQSPFFPTSVLVSGFDIIFFWIARMIMFSLHFTNKIPFHNVYIHGIVQDSQGQKMSKSKGNVIDPIDVIDGISLDDLLKKRTTGLMQPEMKQQIIAHTKKEFPQGFPAFGVDSLRMTFAHQASPGRFVKFDLKRIEVQQQICHKLWNVMKFSLPHCVPISQSLAIKHPMNQWILSRLGEIESVSTQHLQDYRFDLYIQGLIDFMWSDVCDRYVELCKVLLKMPDCATETQHTLTIVMKGLCVLLHPVIPFITEELNSLLHDAMTPDGDYVCLLEQPSHQTWLTHAKIPPALSENIDRFWILLKNIRTVRAKLDIAPKVLLPIDFESPCKVFEEFKDLYANMAKVHSYNEGSHHNFKFLSCIEGSILYRLGIPIADAEERLVRFTSECTKWIDEKNVLDQRLNTPGFQERAPAHVVDKDKNRSEELKQKIAVCQEAISQLI